MDALAALDEGEQVVVQTDTVTVEGTVNTADVADDGGEVEVSVAPDDYAGLPLDSGVVVVSAEYDEGVDQWLQDCYQGAEVEDGEVVTEGLGMVSRVDTE